MKKQLDKSDIIPQEKLPKSNAKPKQQVIMQNTMSNAFAKALQK
jgi:uncharacterized protein